MLVCSQILDACECTDGLERLYLPKDRRREFLWLLLLSFLLFLLLLVLQNQRRTHRLVQQVNYGQFTIIQQGIRSIVSASSFLCFAFAFEAKRTIVECVFVVANSRATGPNVCLYVIHNLLIISSDGFASY